MKMMKSILTGCVKYAMLPKIKYFSNKPYTFNSCVANSASVWTRMCETKDGEGGSELPLFPFFKGVGKYLIYLLTINLRFP